MTSAIDPTYDPGLTGFLIVDPYNDFLSEGGKLYQLCRATLEAHDVVECRWTDEADLGAHGRGQAHQLRVANVTADQEADIGARHLDQRNPGGKVRAPGVAAEKGLAVAPDQPPILFEDGQAVDPATGSLKRRTDDRRKLQALAGGRDVALSGLERLGPRSGPELRTVAVARQRCLREEHQIDLLRRGDFEERDHAVLAELDVLGRHDLARGDLDSLQGFAHERVPVGRRQDDGLTWVNYIF